MDQIAVRPAVKERPHLADCRAIYHQRMIHVPGENVSPLRYPECVIEVMALLPPAE